MLMKRVGGGSRGVSRYRPGVLGGPLGGTLRSMVRVTRSWGLESGNARGTTHFSYCHSKS